jgi:4'-phosphopantetheinyl transferase
MSIPLTAVPAIAARLDDGALHVWRLRYDPRQGRAPLRTLLGAYLGEPADGVELTAGAHGRPQLAEAQAGALDFNWTHSGDCALVALGRHVSPGIDVERRRARPRGLEIARRYFTPGEADWLASQPPDRQDEAFLALWTAKEAVLKALGRGLAFGLHRLVIDAAAGTPQLLRLEDDDAAAWQLLPLALDRAHVATLAWRGAPRKVSQWVLADTG